MVERQDPYVSRLHEDIEGPREEVKPYHFPPEKAPQLMQISYTYVQESRACARSLLQSGAGGQQKT